MNRKYDIGFWVLTFFLSYSGQWTQNSPCTMSVLLFTLFNFCSSFSHCSKCNVVWNTATSSPLLSGHVYFSSEEVQKVRQRRCRKIWIVSAAGKFPPRKLCSSIFASTHLFLFHWAGLGIEASSLAEAPTLDLPTGPSLLCAHHPSNNKHQLSIFYGDKLSSNRYLCGHVPNFSQQTGPSMISI